MTEQPVVIEFIAHANFAELNAAVAGANAQLTQFQAMLSKSSAGNAASAAVSEYTKTLTASKQFAVQNVELTRSVDKFAQAMSRGKLSMAEARKEITMYRNEATRAESHIARLAKQQQLLSQSRIVSFGRTDSGSLRANIATPMDLPSNANLKTVKMTREEMTRLAQVQQIYNQKMIDWGKNTQWSGRQMMVGFTLPMAMFGAVAGKAFYDLDKQLTKMVKVYGDLNTSLNTDQIKELRTQVTGLAQDLASSWGATADVTVGVASDMAAIGKQGNDLIKSTRETVRLSILGGVDQAQSMKTILSLQSAFKTSTDELASSIDFLNAVENQTSATLEDFTAAIPIAGPAVHALGGDVKELAMMLVAMREGGISANQAANALKTSLGRLINPTKAAKDLVKSFGIDLQGIVDKTQGDPLDTIKALQEAMAGLTLLQKDQVMAKIFGLQQYSRMTALFENINKAGGQTQKVMELIGASNVQLAQISERELSRMTESASGKFDRAMQSAKLALAGVGDTFLEIGTTILNVFSKIGEVFDKLPDGIKKLAAAAAIAVAVFGPIRMIQGIAANMFGSMRSSFTSAKAKFVDRIDINAPVETATSTAETLLGDKINETMYEHAKATSVWQKAVDDLIVSLRSSESLLMGNGVGTAATASAVGRSQIAKLMMTAKDSGHTILPDNLEKILVGNGMMISGPTRTVLQDHDMNMDRFEKGGTFFNKPGYAQVDPRAFAYGAAQSANMEKMMAFDYTGPKPKWSNMIALSDRARANPNDEKLVGELNALYKEFEKFFITLEQRTARDAETITELIENIAKRGLTDTEAIQYLESRLRELGVAKEQFDAMIMKGGFDVQSLAAQFMADESLKSGTKIQTGGRSQTDRRYSRVGQIMGALGAAGAPVTVASIDDAGVRLGSEVVAAGKEFGQITIRSATDAAQETLEGINAQRKLLNDELAALTKRQYALGGTMLEKQDIARQITEKKAAVIELNAAENRAKLELATAEQEARLKIQSAIDAAKITETGAVQAATKVSAAQKASGFLKGVGRGGAGGLMGLSMLPLMIPDTGNAAIDQTKSVLGSVGMGAGMGMMIAPGPWGALAGALAGLATSTLPMIIDKVNEAGNAMKASFSVGEAAANSFGAKLATITDIQMTDLIKKTNVSQTAYQTFLDSFTKAEDGSDDKRLIDAMMGASPEEITKLVRNRIAAGFAAGMKPEDLKAEVAAALAASGNSGQLGLMDLIVGKDGKLDTTKLMNDQVKEVRAAMAKAAEDQGPMPAPLGISMAAGQPGSEEWNKEVAAQQEQIDNWKKSIATSSEVQDALKPLADNFMSLAISMKAVDFDKFIKQTDLAGVSSQSFAEYVRNIPGVSEDVVRAMDALSTHGATTTQMLEALNLKSTGVVKTWGELEALPPIQLDIMFAINQTKVDITKTEVAPLLAEARKRLSNIQAAGLWDANTIQKASKTRQDQWNKEKEAVKDRYDKEIDAIKKAEDTRQKAADAEAKRIQRLKQLADYAISYREAIAGGDFAGAARVQNERNNAILGWKQEDASNSAKDKAQAKIDALTASRDAEVKAIEAAQEADNVATQSMLDNLDKHNAAVKKQNADEIAAAQAKVDALIAIQQQPWSKDVQTKIDALAYSMGMSNGAALHDALVKQLGPTGDEIWKRVSGDLTNAPWDLIGQLVDAKINGTGADVTRILALINKWNPAGATTSKIGQGSLANKPLPLSRGGAVWGAGTKTSDSINARLSNGEFVMRAAAVDKYGPATMHAINNGFFASGGLVGQVAGSLAKESVLAGVEAMTSGLFNPGVDAGSMRSGAGGNADIVGSGLGAKIAAFSKQFVGVPYSRTAANPHDGWGCAPFVSWLYAHFGIKLPSSTLSNTQFNGLKHPVRPGDVSAGDLLFYHYANGVNTKNRVNHVGMALNPNTMIEAANPKAGTRISSIDWNHFIGARRVVDPSGKMYKDGGMLMLAQGGEFMMNRNAVNTYGPEMMNAINNRTFHAGGLVTASGPRRDSTATSGGAENHFHIYPSPGMDVDDLVNKVVEKQELAYKRAGVRR